MSIPRTRSGIRTQTPLNLALDVGLVELNWNLEELLDTGADPNTIISRARQAWTYNSAPVTPRKLGATKGGVEYTMGMTQRHVEVDGRRTNIKGLWRVDMLEPSIKLNLLEAGDYEVAQKAHGAASVSTIGPYQRIMPLLEVDDDRDYFHNIVILQTVSGSTLPILYILRNPKVVQQETLSQTDKNEMVIPVTIVANTDIDEYYDTETPPSYAPAEMWIPSGLSS